MTIGNQGPRERPKPATAPLDGLFENCRLHRTSFLTIGDRVLAIRTLKADATLDKAERDAFCTLAQRGFDVLILRLNSDGNPASALVAPAWRALDAPAAFDNLDTADAVREWIHAWLKNARRTAGHPPPAKPKHATAPQ